MDITWQYALGLALIMASVSNVKIPYYYKDNQTQLFDLIGKILWLVFLIWGLFEFTWWKPISYSFAWIFLIAFVKIKLIDSPGLFLFIGSIICLYSLGIV
jgi:hypothetical protein